jgi:sorbose reductase
MNDVDRRKHRRLLISLFILVCALLLANLTVMVRKPATVPVVEPLKKKAPEDSSMKDGLFQEGNTVAPSETSVVPLFSLKHKTAIISGSDRGIGLAVAQAFAEAGANIAIWYHSNKEAYDRAAEIADKYGVKCISTFLKLWLRYRKANYEIGKAYQVDVTDYENTKKVMNDSIRDLNGRLDIFVANAGIPWTQGRMIDGELSHYRRVVSTDLDSVFYSAKAAGEVFRRQYETGVDIMGDKLQHYRYGSFVATASMSGHIANIPQLQSAVRATTIP